MQAVPLPQAGGNRLRISSSRSVRYLSRANAEQPQTSVFDRSAPTVPFVPFKEVFSPARGNAFASGSDASSSAGSAGGSSMPGPQGSSASTLLEYIRHLNQLDAHQTATFHGRLGRIARSLGQSNPDGRSYGPDRGSYGFRSRQSGCAAARRAAQALARRAAAAIISKTETPSARALLSGEACRIGAP